ncbi:MBL fold metallo-hydrolase [Brachybacterium sp. EF45031]|uniref:MBL fold metallo-hydrolase n=1 Tax=Brachybacterium sillae TaxID=2810536 RepID=UPI00217DB6D5|nr:MBL fold metallo-hydrolase [Brachybacterium sillae]MCS6712131.1 MBL fold metallo-hydrolase [Brachybacterium sillae]
MTGWFDRVAEADPVELLCLRAPNPGPMTLDGTNTYVLRDGAQSWVVDPGPRDIGHLTAILRACGLPGPAAPQAVIVTHRHADHAEAAGTLVRQLRQRTGAPVELYASDPTAVPGARVPPAELIGERGTVAHVLHLPGHTADSLALLVEGGRLLSGDTLLGGSSTTIVPPDGSLTDLLASLEVLQAMSMDGRIAGIHPGHGEPIESPHEARDAIDEALAHRRERIEQVRAARAEGLLTMDRLVRRLHGDTLPPELREAAEWNILAAITHLREEGGGPRD